MRVSWKSAQWVILHLQRSRIFHISSPIWVKFHTEDLNGMTSECEFRENRRKEDSTFRMSIKGLYFECAVKPYDTWKVKNASIKSLHCVTEYITCNLVKYFTNIHCVSVLFTLFICLNTSEVTTKKRVEFSYYSALLKHIWDIPLVQEWIVLTTKYTIGAARGYPCQERPRLTLSEH